MSSILAPTAGAAPQSNPVSRPGRFAQTIALMSIGPLIRAMGPAGMRQACVFVETFRAKAAAAGRAPGDSKVMLAFGGGKDSAFALAFARTAQILLLARTGCTFELKVVLFRHPGMTDSVMANVARVLDRLHIPGDPLVEVCVVDDGRLLPFDPTSPVPHALARRAREALLMAGHLSAGQARPSFCNDCNAEMVAAFDAAVRAWNPDFVLTGDSPSEQRAYYKWTSRLAKHAGSIPPGRGFGQLIDSIRSLDRRYQAALHGEELDHKPLPAQPPANPEFLSLYDHTHYAAGSHRQVLQFLRFRFGPASFVGTETDCANPALMAHLRGLLLERVRGQTYDRGIEEYTYLWTVLMARKQFPRDLIARMVRRYRADKRPIRRAEAEAFARDAFGLDDEALTAIVFSPFTSRGRNLDAWLKSRGTTWDLDTGAIINAIEHGATDDPILAKLSRITALSPSQIRHLFRQELVAPAVRPCGQAAFTRESGGGHFVVRLLQDDPHQVAIRTRVTSDGPEVEELVSGR